MKQLRVLGFLGVLFSLLFVGSLPSAQAGQTAKLTNWKVLNRGGFKFYAYDQTSTTLSRNGIDWPISLIFGRNSTVNGVKSLLKDPYDRTGSTMYFFWRRGSLSMDSDKGMKTTRCPGLWTQPAKALHYRIYGHPSTDKFYNKGWGWFNLASTHQDWYECPKNNPNKKFMNGEQTEAHIAKLAASKRGFGRVKRNRIPLHNAESGWQGIHHYNSNGLATWIVVR